MRRRPSPGRGVPANLAVQHRVVERVAPHIGVDAAGHGDLDRWLDADRAQALVSPGGTIQAATDRFRALHPDASGAGFLGRWDEDRLADVVGGVVTQVDLDSLEDCGPGVIVSAVRAENAELGLLAVEAIEY